MKTKEEIDSILRPKSQVDTVTSPQCLCCNKTNNMGKSKMCFRCYRCGCYIENGKKVKKCR